MRNSPKHHHHHHHHHHVEMMQIIQDGEYLPNSEETLLSAFRVLDPNGNGYIPCAELEKCMTTMGTDFRPIEAEKFIATFREAESDNFFYEDYCAKLAAENEKHALLQ